MRKYSLILITILLQLNFSSCVEKNQQAIKDYSQWRSFGGTYDAARYSSLSQITKENVKNLEVAWTYNTGDATERSQIQTQPIVIGDILYGVSPQLNVFALKADSGKPIWRFNPFQVLGGENSWAGLNRGLTYWEDGNDKRIFSSASNYLMALDAETGRPIETFGDNGLVDLKKDLDTELDDFLLVSNSPGVIYEDKIIIGMRLSEGLDAAPGHIRAYNVRTGEREWIFHTIPHPGEFGHDTWDEKYWDKIGGANNWAGMTVDVKRGIVFVPTGSATYDFWGGYRHGQNLFANTLLALDANTGERIWHFQGVHHDMWDRDFPANPNLIRIKKDGKWIDAVAQTSKQGYVFVFDRETGESVWPLEERFVPQSELEGEKSWPTQPHPTLPVPFMRMAYTENEILRLTPEWEKDIRGKLENLKYGDMWEPPSDKHGIVLFPGMDGGAEWGGSSFDPYTQTLYVNANEVPWVIKMKLNPSYDNIGQKVYVNYCGNCHGIDGKGNPPVFPSLENLNEKFDWKSLDLLIKNGKGAMPAFSHISDTDRKLLTDYLLGSEIKAEEDKKEMEGGKEQLFPKYNMEGYSRLLTDDGYPGIQPPWGTLTAINMNTGRIKWQSVLGEFEELTAKGFQPTGTENYGGPATTAGGLVFIAATKDEKIRAFDKDTGRVLWEAKLPAAGHATPAIYEVKGKQYIVIACGGGKGTKSGDAYVAFALPE
ncbi:MAG: pyrroloquinoline quinone-dependent dehydrogenase [Mongoliibacter sp.]|uniref:outer membrane protein assembly factor BamB family protein n=1 Tax=Mongoliibacter sp. TaxID=2022438 RepID=UPI0012EF2FCF|nr:PQQ-binding-like beta-propeller repeat protein [Mongoliibacter sp.]TVP51026.1 MAG: pyrroloquinoline quinone-dependent dehydrogenase [Mongoliibacter sp.]